MDTTEEPACRPVALTAFTDGDGTGFDGRARFVADTIADRERAEMRPDMRVVVVRLGDGSGWGWLVWDDEGGILASDDGGHLETAEDAERVASEAARRWYTLIDDEASTCPVAAPAGETRDP
jgi:hypothetical protein